MAIKKKYESEKSVKGENLEDLKVSKSSDKQPRATEKTLFIPNSSA